MTMKQRYRNNEFIKYILLSVLGMLGSSGTILADTFFVANRLGPDGLTALNLSISVFGLINGLGMMLGIGGATRYAIFRAKGYEKEADRTFTLTLLTAGICGIALSIFGALFSEQIAFILGADSEILPMCNAYLQTVLCFAPFFILNHFFMAFIRNDGNPKLAMAVMLAGSGCNILLDYLFMYPMDMGIFGAALATGLAPVIGLMTASVHVITRKNRFHLCAVRFSFREIRGLAGLGVSAFINEFSSGFVLVIFNLLILRLAGNVGVAAYGIIANLALVALAVFTGISQGIQPLISRAYGKKEEATIQNLYRKGIRTAFMAGVIFLAIAWIWTTQLVSVFNSENNKTLQMIAEKGLRIYFIGFLFVGMNFLTTALFGASEKAKEAFITSFFRGFAGIILIVFLSAYFAGMTGIWMSFAITELVTLFLCCFFLRRGKRDPIYLYRIGDETKYSKKSPI